MSTSQGNLIYCTLTSSSLMCHSKRHRYAGALVGAFWSEYAKNSTGSLFGDAPSICQFSSKSIQFYRRYARKCLKKYDIGVKPITKMLLLRRACRCALRLSAGQLQHLHRTNRTNSPDANQSSFQLVASWRLFPTANGVIHIWHSRGLSHWAIVTSRVWEKIDILFC